MQQPDWVTLCDNVVSRVRRTIRTRFPHFLSYFDEPEIRSEVFLAIVERMGKEGGKNPGYLALMVTRRWLRSPKGPVRLPRASSTKRVPGHWEALRTVPLEEAEELYPETFQKESPDVPPETPVLTALACKREGRPYDVFHLGGRGNAEAVVREAIRMYTEVYPELALPTAHREICRMGNRMLHGERINRGRRSYRQLAALYVEVYRCRRPRGSTRN